jgi:hypothetical protein
MKTVRIIRIITGNPECKRQFSCIDLPKSLDAGNLFSLCNKLLHDFHCSTEGKNEPIENEVL